jgi:hypothetical protein
LKGPGFTDSTNAEAASVLKGHGFSRIVIGKKPMF